MNKTTTRRVATAEYISQNQMVIEGFETPFYQTLDHDNRWVALAGKIPWDELANLYLDIGLNLPEGHH